jgi:hypothetical protein
MLKSDSNKEIISIWYRFIFLNNLSCRFAISPRNTQGGSVIIPLSDPLLVFSGIAILKPYLSEEGAESV